MNFSFSMFHAALLLLAVFFSTCVATAWVRAFALQVGLLDKPNHRSSHQVVTARGGGLAFVLVFLAGLVGLCVFYPDQAVLKWFGAATALVALGGFLDDRGLLSLAWRLGIQTLGVVLVLVGTGGMPAIDFGVGSLNLGVFSSAFAVLGLLWLLNLTNFMDGIDGLAASQIIVACAVSAGLLWAQGAMLVYVVLPALLAATVSGFLVWNFPPAKIFMGDVGSATLGLLSGAFAVWHMQLGSQWLFVWLILLGVLVVDATFTLFARLCRRQKVSEAHRSHAYQRAARRCGAHKPVTLFALAISIVWLAPWAWLVSRGLINGALALLLSYTPLVALAFYFRAGMQDD